MHMADALVSPAVGGSMWLASGGLLFHCGRIVRRTLRENLVPMMGVLGAFVFAAQMINFSIPGTGSSGHLGGGLMLAVLLGPHAAFIVIASVLTVQALFFADGGLLALGCNVFNLGFFPCFVAYPWVYRPLARRGYRAAAAVAAAVVGLQLGAFGVVFETWLSGLSALPLGTFLMLMQPIHLAIGIVEGLATAAVVGFVVHARPDALEAGAMAAHAADPVTSTPKRGVRPVVLGLLVSALFIGGIVSWFASAYPDGLEWAVARAAGREDVAGKDSSVHARLEQLQRKTALLPDYSLPSSADLSEATERETPGTPEPWPAPAAGTSLSGVVGGFLCLVAAGLIGLALRRGARLKAA